MCAGSAVAGLVGGLFLAALGFVLIRWPTAVNQLYSRVLGVDPLMLAPRFMRSLGWQRFTGGFAMVFSAVVVLASVQGLISGCPR